MVKTQQQAYMLEKSTNQIPTVDELLREKYIDQKQLEAYNNAPQELKNAE